MTQTNTLIKTQAIQPMDKALFSLKGHKQMRGMDGYVYDGTLMYDAKPICHYHDQGNGGGMMLHFTKPYGELKNRFNAFIKTLPNSAPDEWFPKGIEASSDGFIEELIIDAEQKKRIKRACKTKTVFRLKGDEGGTFRTLSGGICSAASREWLAKKFGDKVELVYDQNGEAV